MGVCLSKPPQRSTLVDGGGSIASRPDPPPGVPQFAVVESTGFVQAPRVTADDPVAADEDERAPRRRKTDADDSVAVDAGASGSNPSAMSGR